MANVDSIIETKLTKGEAIDFLVAEMQTAIEEQLTALRKQKKKLKSEFTFDELKPVLEKMTFNVEREYNKSDSYEVNFDYDYGSTRNRFKLSALPKETQEKVKAIMSVDDQIETLEKQERKLNDKKSNVRQQVLRSMLEGTDEGKRFLAYLTDVRVRLAPRMTALLGAKKDD